MAGFTMTNVLAKSVDHNNYIQPIQSIKAAHEAGMNPVAVRMEIESIYNISLKDSSFMADGFLTINFPEQIAADKQISPQKPCFVFENDIERNQFTIIETRESMQIDSNDPSHKYKFAYDFSGKFSMGSSNQYRRSPFSKLKLQINLAPVCKFDYIQKKVALVPDDQGETDTLNNFLVANLKVPIGYNLEKSSLHSEVRRWPKSSYSWMAANITLETSRWASFFRWVVPLLIVMTIVIAAPSLNRKYYEARLSIPSASMLTLVFLHETYHSDLPNFPYLTYLDKLYIFAYASCLVVFILFIIDSHRDGVGRQTLKINLPLVGQKVILTEQLVQVLCLICMSIVAIAGWYF